MSFKIVTQVLHNVSLPPSQKLVLIVLADLYNEESGKAWPSQDTLRAFTGLSLRSVNRARKLQEKHRNEYYLLQPLYEDCKKFLLTAQTDDDWKKFRNGLPNPLNL